jgi:Serine phosphatase RsbU, regulator of sigma subunit
MRVCSPSVAIPGFDFASLSEPRYRQGGDYHEVFVAPGCVGLAVGDVAGHDSVAAGLKRTAGRLLKGRAAVPGALGPFMDGVNRDLSPHMRDGRFMTLFLAVMVAEPRSIHWVSAGHGPVIGYDPETSGFVEVPGADIPLGVDPGWSYHEQQHMGWATGALMVVGTDGVWEARDPNGRVYGKRLLAAIRQVRHLPAAGIVRAVVDDLTAFRRGEALADDATLVVVKAV